ncbi:MAG: alpha/beta hydrolase [Verrucomicrobia bacterium]|nr:alpha/beta hydrolase [Verrucomicrobiota bacterium]
MFTVTRHLSLALAIIVLGTLSARAQATSETDDRLQRALKQFPAADANQDGVLTEAEARAYLQENRNARPGKKSPARSGAAPGGQPTLADVHYGPHERNVLDFWRAKSDKPAPVVVFIHGGGFTAGDKSKARDDKMVQQCLDTGVSFAAINYRYRTTAPIQDVLRDCARAIQFIRSKAGEWNLDKTRVASYGGSAGAGTSLWLAFHDDLADPKNSDPVLRESTRLSCAGANSTQFSYDIVKWEQLFGEAGKKFQRQDEDQPGFYGLKTDAELRGPVGAKLRADCDMHGLISKDDPPVFLNTSQPGGELTDRGHLLHHPKHAKAVLDRCRELGVGVVAQIPGLGIKPDAGGPQDLHEFLFKHLRVVAP